MTGMDQQKQQNALIRPQERLDAPFRREENIKAAGQRQKWKRASPAYDPEGRVCNKYGGFLTPWALHTIMNAMHNGFSAKI